MYDLGLEWKLASFKLGVYIQSKRTDLDRQQIAIIPIDDAISTFVFSSCGHGKLFELQARKDATGGL